MSTQRTAYPETEVQKARETSGSGKEGSGTDIREKLQDLVQRGQTRVAGWKDGVEDGIREKPWQSILIAGAVGALIGVLVGRRGR